jgi:hypothetical protein
MHLMTDSLPLPRDKNSARQSNGLLKYPAWVIKMVRSSSLRVEVLLRLVEVRLQI